MGEGGTFSRGCGVSGAATDGFVVGEGIIEGGFLSDSNSSLLGALRTGDAGLAGGGLRGGDGRDR